MQQIEYSSADIQHLLDEADQNLRNYAEQGLWPFGRGERRRGTRCIGQEKIRGMGEGGGGHLNSVRDPVGCHSCYTAVINMVLVKGQNQTHWGRCSHRNRPRLSNRRNSFHKKKVILLPQDWLLGHQRIDRHFILSAVGGVKIVSPISTFVLNTLILKLIKGIFLDTNGFYDVMCKGSVLLTGGMKLNSKKKKKNKEIKILNIFCNMILSHQALVYFYSFFFLCFFFFFFLVGYYRQTIHTGYQIQHSRLWIRTLVLSSRFG